MKWVHLIANHYHKNWGVEGQPCSFLKGPIHQLPADFQVLAFPPHPKRTLWTYATRGMSQPRDTGRVELHLFSPTQSEAIVELIVATAHFHRTGASLGLWHTVNFGRPWLPSSLCTHGLISLPYLDGPGLENLETPDGGVKFYWLIPITPAELEWKKAKGIEALEEKLEASGFDYANPLRTSVL